MQRQIHRLSSERLALALLAMAAFAAFGCATPKSPPATPIPPTYRVGPPDQLLVSVLPDPIIERSVVVRPDGNISFDLIGDVRASGRTTREIADEIEKRIARFKRDARAMVSVQASQTAQVTVFGEVGAPGLLQLTTDTSVAEAVGARGGTTFLGWRSRVRLIRYEGGTTHVYRINLAAIQAGDLTTNMLVQGGDIVVVPKTPLGVVGTVIQQIVFPFNALIGPGFSAAGLARTF